MVDDRFWELVEGSGTPSALHDRLDALDADELVGFERAWDRAMDGLYRWDLWGAAYVLDGGCSDDSFEYFRAYVISRGRATYDLAINDPDALAAVDLEDGEVWEHWMCPAMTVVERRTGTYDFAGPPDPDREPLGDPAGESWEEEDLPARFPRMTARYG